MKNTCKLFGIIALAAVIMFSMAACKGKTSGSSAESASVSASTASSNVPSELIGKWGMPGMVLFEFTTDGLLMSRAIGGNPDVTVEIRKSGDSIEANDPDGTGWAVFLKSYRVSDNKLITFFGDDDNEEEMEFDKLD
ncbi:MAG: hypothetical protein FWD36_08380 [Treponema sp.]|nr:hypothetical protein [Treponema sp.]